MLREIARQGLLPFPSFFSSIKPFGTPFGPVALRSVFTVIVLLIVPAKDAFNFIMDLVSYPHLVNTPLLTHNLAHHPFQGVPIIECVWCMGATAKTDPERDVPSALTGERHRDIPLFISVHPTAPSALVIGDNANNTWSISDFDL